MEKTLYLIRHGLIQSNIDNVYAGRNDEKLTEAGVRQAEEVGSEMRGFGISVIYASPLARTMQTAEIINKYVKAKILPESGLIEMDLGPWTGLSKDEVALRYSSAYQTWYQRPAEFSFDGMETVEQILERIKNVIDKFLRKNPERTAAMVTHAALIKCAFLYVNNLSLDLYHKTHVPNLSVFRISFYEGGARIIRVK